MAASRVRWECPNGKHPGVLGSRRPRRENIVRYCLPCSEKAGKLVERRAPALERDRAHAAERTKRKVEVQRQRAAVAKAAEKKAENDRYIVDGVDLRAEFERLCRLRVFGGRAGRLAQNPPRFDINRRRSEPVSRLGWSDWRENRFMVATWPGQSAAAARETLVHELVHIHLENRDRGHGPLFAKTMTTAFRQAYGVEPTTWKPARFGGHYAEALREYEQQSA